MSDIKKDLDPAGEINEQELMEIIITDEKTGGAAQEMPIIMGATVLLCPTVKCTFRC